jgi:hypothetical protein
MSELVICPLPVVSPILCIGGVQVVVRFTFTAKERSTPWRVTFTLKFPVSGATFRYGRVARIVTDGVVADHSTLTLFCNAAGIVKLTEIFPVAVPVTLTVRERFVSFIVALVGLNVTVEVGVKFVTTVVPVKAILFVFRIVFGSVAAHVNVFVAPAAALKVAGGVHVTASGDCVEVGEVVIAAVAGSVAITAAAFAAVAVNVLVAGGAVKVAKFGAVVVTFVTVTAQACVTPWRVTVTLKFPFNAAMSVLGRTARTVIVVEVGDHSTVI